MDSHSVLRSPRQARSRQSELRLLEATLALVEEGGLAACSIPDVAKRAGVAVGTIYRRFRDKNDLLERSFLHRLESVSTSASVPQYKDLQTAARSIVRAFLTNFESYEIFYSALIDYTRDTPNQRFREAAAAARLKTISHLSKSLIDAAAKDSEEITPKRATFALVALTTALSALLRDPIGRMLQWSDGEEREKALTDLFLGALVGKPEHDIHV